MFKDFADNYEASTGGCTREVAIHLTDMLPPVDADSVVLDNACGNGIVAQELFFKNPDTPLKMTCVDGVKAMVDLARHVVPAVASSAAELSFDVMDGVKLSLPNETFTHSITNMGIFFFSDASAGAYEIYRTLKRDGTAIVTSWKYFGYLPVIHEAQKAVKPDDPLFKWPIADEWYEASHLEKTLKSAGFGSVEMHEKTVYYASKTVEEACGYLFGMWKKVGPKWTEQEHEEMRKELLIAGKKTAAKAKRPVNRKRDAEMMEVEGFPMVAHVAVARK